MFEGFSFLKQYIQTIWSLLWLCLETILPTIFPALSESWLLDKSNDSKDLCVNNPFVRISYESLSKMQLLMINVLIVELFTIPYINCYITVERNSATSDLISKLVNLKVVKKLLNERFLAIPLILLYFYWDKIYDFGIKSPSFAFWSSLFSCFPSFFDPSYIKFNFTISITCWHYYLLENVKFSYYFIDQIYFF